MPYTSQTLTDVAIIEAVLRECAKLGHVKFLEIGTYGGDTAREVKKWCDDRTHWVDEKSLEFEFWGIDNGSHPTFKECNSAPSFPFPSARMVFGDSAEVFSEVPEDFDAILVDGCHCINHAILDTVHYGRRVRLGGFLMFHDTSPEVQQTMRDPHGPDRPEFYNSVVAAHKLIGFPTPGWSLWKSGFERGARWGGMTVYQKTISGF